MQQLSQVCLRRHIRGRTERLRNHNSSRLRSVQQEKKVEDHCTEDNGTSGVMASSQADECR